MSNTDGPSLAVPDRIIVPEPHEEFFWTSGADGVLRFLGCDACGRLHHPPLPRCPYCRDADVSPMAVSGRATIATFTINRQPFMPGFEPPYVIAIVEIEEDPTIRLTTNLVDIAVDDVEIGLPVMASFERNGDWYVPLFTRR